MIIPYEFKRHECAVSQLEAQPAMRGGLLLYGSSFLTNWGYARSRAQLGTVCGLTVTNHGFGGSVVDDILYYYRRLVTPYAPSAVLLRLGVNDINAGLSAQDTFSLTLRVLAWLRADWPNIPIAMIGTFDYPTCAEDKRAHMAHYTELCAQWAADHAAALIDVNDFVYEQPGMVGTYTGFRPVFLKDGLHLTDEGYAKMSAWIKPRLEAWLTGSL